MERRQILLGRRGNYLQGDGETNALFSGIKEHIPPPGGLINLNAFTKILALTILFKLSPTSLRSLK